jgi:hypothetical protein
MAGYAELIIDQGTTFNTIITIADETSGLALNVSGYSFASQVRKSYYSVNATADIVCTITDSANGVLAISMSNTVTGGIAPGRYVYDVRMADNNGNVTRVVEGIMTITPQVTVA